MQTIMLDVLQSQAVSKGDMDAQLPSSTLRVTAHDYANAPHSLSALQSSTAEEICLSEYPSPEIAPMLPEEQNCDSSV